MAAALREIPLAPSPAPPRHRRPTGHSRLGHFARRAADRLRLCHLHQHQSQEPADPLQRGPGPAGGNLLIDTPPELRSQLVREGVGLVHAVLYTHNHADHLFGLDNLRIFSQYLGTDLPVFCRPVVEERIRKAFDYAFDPVTRQYPAGGVPRLAFRK